MLFRSVEDVLAVFVKNGVRQVTNILLRQSDPNKIYDELAAEAIQGALARGRKMATLAGMTNLEVADININPMPNAFPNPGVNQGQSAISRTATGETGMFVGMTATVLLALPKSAK